MKKTILGAALASALGALPGTTAAQTTYGDVARVVSATPIHERVSVPGRECRLEAVTRYEERRSVRPAPEAIPVERAGNTGAGAVLGAIVGGVIGHQFGNSSGGRDRGTAAGAIVGGLIGNSIESDAQADYRPAGREVLVERVPVTRDVERCEEVAETRERIVAYDVRYEYNGREFRTRLPYDPGAQLPVNVDVRPPMARDPYAAPPIPRYRGPY